MEPPESIELVRDQSQNILQSREIKRRKYIDQIYKKTASKRLSKKEKIYKRKVGQEVENIPNPIPVSSSPLQTWKAEDHIENKSQPMSSHLAVCMQVPK